MIHKYEQKYPEVASKIVVLMPGDSISSDMNFTEISEKNIMEECFVNKKKYLSDYKNRRNDIITDGLSKIDEINYSLYDKCVKYFYPLMISAKDLCYNIGNSILLNITGQDEGGVYLQNYNHLQEMVPNVLQV